MRRRQPSTDFLLMCRSLRSAPALLNSLLVLCSSTEEAVQIQSRKRTKTLLGSFLGEKNGFFNYLGNTKKTVLFSLGGSLVSFRKTVSANFSNWI